jgi:hypothetical protein
MPPSDVQLDPSLYAGNGRQAGVAPPRRFCKPGRWEWGGGYIERIISLWPPSTPPAARGVAQSGEADHVVSAVAYAPLSCQTQRRPRSEDMWSVARVMYEHHKCLRRPRSPSSGACPAGIPISPSMFIMAHHTQ